MYYEPQSGMYFSYDPITQTHQYHGRASQTKVSLLSHIIYNRSLKAADSRTHADSTHKPHKVITLWI